MKLTKLQNKKNNTKGKLYKKTKKYKLHRNTKRQLGGGVSHTKLKDADNLLKLHLLSGDLNSILFKYVLAWSLLRFSNNKLSFLEDHGKFKIFFT